MLRQLAAGFVVVLLIAAPACSSSADDTTTTTSAQAMNTTTSTSASTTTTQASTTTTTTVPATTTTTSFPIDESADPFPPEDLVGQWFIEAGYLHTFTDDGLWTLVWPETPEEVSDAGSWEVKVATLIIVSELEENKTRCQPGDTGYYEISHGGDGELDLKPLDDDCIARWGGLRHGLTPAG
jgi:hypothetical protein